MAVGSSGRVVIEVNPELKQQLHELLRRRGTNLRAWFIDQAVEFIEENDGQLDLELEEPTAEGNSP
jgi:hypothetical protein